MTLLDEVATPLRLDWVDRLLQCHPLLDFRVHGVPAPQGSKRAIVNRHTGKAALVEDSKRTKPWRETVKSAAIDARAGWLDTAAAADHWAVPDGPLTVVVTFWLPRPKHHYRTGKNTGLLRDNAPRWPTVKIDVDKAVRPIFDSCTDAGLWRDDSQVVEVHAFKEYATDFELPGCRVRIWTKP